MLVRFRNVLREFVVRYRQGDGNEVAPATMMGYVRSINRALKLDEYEVNIFKQHVIQDKKDGLMAVLDNQFEEQQSRGMTVKHHNTLLRADFELLLDHAV